jgi:hypothetical protein
MANEKITSILETLDTLTVIELSELVSAVEERYGVSAAAAVALPVDLLPCHRNFPTVRHGISGSAGPGIGPVDYLPGAAAHHGNGKPDSRNGTKWYIGIVERI